MKTKISTIGMSREDWLEHRRQSIGGSDAATIVGLNPYSSPYELWADKLGRIPPKEDNEAMRQGRDLEDYVARRFMAETGKRVRRENNIIKNSAVPFAHANVDRLVIGEKAGLEQGERKNAVKTAENLLKMNLLTPEQIAKAVELPLEEILKLKKKFEV